MKQLLTILIVLFSTLSIKAKCSDRGLWIFPSGQTIRQNSIFVLDGYATSQKIILGLNKTHNIYLKSGNKTIKLLVMEICVGQFHLTQALLKPETELEAGLEYSMYIDDLPKYESFEKYNRTTKKYESVTYKVIAGKDTEKPLLSATPKELKKTLVQYGCGPSINVVFSNPAKDDSDVIVKTTVKNLRNGLETVYYLESVESEMKVGHDMCSGGFVFDDSENYEVEFSFIDASGNRTIWKGERIKFTKPNKLNSNSVE